MASTLNVGVIYILYKQHLYKKLTVAMLIAVNVVLLLALVFGHGVLTLLLNASGYVLYLLCLAAVGRAWLSGEKSAGYMFTAFLLYMISLLFFFGSRIMAGFGSTLGVYNVFGAVGEFIFYGVTILAFFVRYIESYFQNLSQIRTLDNQLSDKERSLSEAYGQLTRFEAARTRMLRDFAHDLKTPVTSVLGYLSMMASGEITQTHEVRQTAGKMLTRVRQIRDMSHNLSGLMTLEQGEIKMQMTPCAAADIMAGIQPHYGQKCAAAGLALTVSNNASGNVLADMTQIMRVFDNLIDNAVRHTPTGGHITVSAEDCGNNGMRFCVADTGCGIPEDQQPYVFGRFYRADASRAQSGVHQGLGLAICYEIIKAHRGMISVESVPGQGAKFCFTLKRPAEEC
jgi:signal transduction histidine kinase